MSPSLQNTLALLEALTPFRSVAGELAEQQALAQWLEDWLVRELKTDVVLPVQQQLQQAAPPLVHARLDIGASSTIVLYNMYDVMPANDEGWQVPPFSGGLRDWPELGPVYIARGAENNKGPLAGMLMAVKNLLDQGLLAVNIEFLLEGEEEIGSGYLRRYLAQQPCPLPQARAALFPSLCEYGGGAPRLYLGFSGLSGGRLHIQGGSWGGPHQGIHASNAAWIANPIWRLLQALTTLAPAEDNGVLAVREIDDEAESLLATLASTFSLSDELRFRHTERFSVSGDSLTSLRHLLSRAVLNLSAIDSSPAGARGVIPSSASAELALRVPPGIDHQALVDKLHQQLATEALAGVELQLDDSYPGHRFARHAPGVDELIASYQQQGTQPQIWPWAPGCAPAYAFAPIAPAFLIGGLGYGGNAHGVNEFVTLQGLQRFQQSISDWLILFSAPHFSDASQHQGISTAFTQEEKDETAR